MKPNTYSILWREQEDFPITWHIQSSGWTNKRKAISRGRQEKRDMRGFSSNLEFIVVKIEKVI